MYIFLPRNTLPEPLPKPFPAGFTSISSESISADEATLPKPNVEGHSSGD
jgi:hypothetical protein